MIEGIFNDLRDEVHNLYKDYKGTDDEFCEQVRDNVLSFINLLPIKQLNKIEDIYPNPNGTVSISFGEHEIEIGNKTMSYFIQKSTIIYGDNKKINQDEVDIFINYIL